MKSERTLLSETIHCRKNRTNHVPNHVLSPTIKGRAEHKHTLVSIRIYAIHIATLHGQQRDEAQHIAQLLQRGELPVSAVATAAHGPGDEGTRRGRTEDSGGESSAVFERKLANSVEVVREREGGKPNTAFEGVFTY